MNILAVLWYKCGVCHARKFNKSFISRNCAHYEPQAGATAKHPSCIPRRLKRGANHSEGYILVSYDNADIHINIA